nr:IS982 family transposase [Candidatus Accumulibacter phosphatis]
MTRVVLFHQIRYRPISAVSSGCQAARLSWPHCSRNSRASALGGRLRSSPPIAIRENLRIPRHQVFQGMVARGKSSAGWFFGFKLHGVIHHLGELLGVRLTPGKVDDSQPLYGFAEQLFGKRYADKGDISQWLPPFLKDLGIDFVTKVRKNREPVALDPFDQAMLRQRSLVETVIDELKNLFQIEHPRHRSPIHFAVNPLAGLIAYCLMPNQPKLSLQDVRRLSQSPKLIPN